VLWKSGCENVSVPAGSLTPVTVVPVGCGSGPKAVIVYGPSVDGGAFVPGEPSKTIGGVVVQVPPEQFVSVATVEPLWMFVVGGPFGSTV
jgi:hypothetical protein